MFNFIAGLFLSLATTATTPFCDVPKENTVVLIRSSFHQAEEFNPLLSRIRGLFSNLSQQKISECQKDNWRVILITIPNLPTALNALQRITSSEDISRNEIQIVLPDGNLHE